MTNIKKILKNIKILKSTKQLDSTVNSIHFDSRKIKENDMFFAIRGTEADGHLFIDKAIINGARNIICEELPAKQNDEVNYIKVKNSREALAIAANNYYDNPTSKLKLIGITGTNGKTTIATSLYQLFTLLGYNCGLVSTIRNLIGTKEIKATHTTPDSIQLNSLFNEMVADGCEYVFMEVSSHSIEQNRIFALEFDAAVFTNLTQDHLDYHKTFANYRDAKKKFFDDLSKNAFSLINADDKNAKIMVQNTKSKVYNYALKTPAEFKTKIIERHFDATLIELNGKELWTKLIGTFNIYNLTAIYGLAKLLGIDEGKLLLKISELSPVEGRMEYLKDKDNKIIIIDYAHTPDALDNLLKTIKELKKTDTEIITVFGAGGNRDKDKRPKMGRIAEKYSDTIIITADNPRNEKQEDIAKDIEKGMQENKTKVLKITNREEAIKTACLLANENDIIVIAGKGHEKYQEVNGAKYDFDDKEIVLSMMK